MARAWKKSTTPDTEQQPTEIRQQTTVEPVSLELLEETLERITANLTAAKTRKRELQRSITTDPVGTTVTLRGLTEEIENLDEQAKAYGVLIEEAEAAAVVAAEAAAIEASKANLELAKKQINVVIDRAGRAQAMFSEGISELREMRAAADVGFSCWAEFLAERYGNNTNRMIDHTVLVGPRAAANSADMAAAMTSLIQQILDIMQSPSLDNAVTINQFAPKNISSLATAAKMDAQFLLDRFGDGK